MQTRRPLFGVTVGLLLSLSPALRAAQAYSPNRNFLVTAPTEQMAQQFGQAAEQYRRQKALEWLGHEMPPWPRPCPLTVRPKPGGPSGATRFNYDFHGGYELIDMVIEGDEARMLHSVLPHEVTHTVFAHAIRYPVPRWADEGGAVLSEDDAERRTHDQICRQKLNQHTAVPLRRLFTVREYYEVPDMMVIYAQGYSVAQYLVNLAGRQTFLRFVRQGMSGSGGDWDRAAQSYYNFSSIEAMEQAWLQHLRETKNGPAQLVRNNQPARTDPASRTVVRQTAPPAPPQLEPAGPVARGQSDDDPRHATLTSRPSHLPERAPEPAAVPAVQLPPPASRPAPPMPPVRLGTPEFGPTPASVTAPLTPGTTTVGRGN